MAKYVFGNDDGGHYSGLEKIFAYTNWDGKRCEVNCGQAAGATYLTHFGEFQPESHSAEAVMMQLEQTYPPDNLFGYLGTSRRCLMRLCKGKGMPVKPIAGEEKLRKCLLAEIPVIVMLGVSAGKLWKFELPGGHWMVAYGFDEENVYLTNWGTMTWDEFRHGWNGVVPRLISMCNIGLVAKNPLAG